MTEPSTIDPERRARLVAAKLAALVRGREGDGDRQPGTFPAGATLLEGERAWVLLDEVTPRSAGGVLVWASRAGAQEVDVIVDADVDPTLAADLARRCAWFGGRTRVWTVQPDRDWEAVEAGPVPSVAPGPDGVETLVDLLVAHGCEVVTEHGVVRGERLGLEVARVVEADGAYRLETGVGRFDREVGAMVRAELSAADSLGAVLTIVDRVRHPGAPPHPVRDLCRERWVRVTLEKDPALAGFELIEPVESTVERPNLRDPHPAMAVGTRPGGKRVVVACTSGVDVDLLPVAEDTRRREAPDAPLVIVHPEGSVIPPAALSAAAWLPQAPEVVSVPSPWAAPAG